MKSTKECLEYASNHAWLSKGFKKLNAAEISLVTEFLNRDFPSKSDAMLAVNRIFLELEKTKNWTTVVEIASTCITHRYS
jgi:hypothetical protein